MNAPTDPSSRNPQLAPLIELAHHRWNIPVIAELSRGPGAKFVTMANRLGASRASLSSSLAYLIRLGLVEKNEGHGHPMRPEYLLTPTGRDISEQCRALIRVLRRDDETDLAFRKWTLPLLAVIGDETRRFNELSGRLEGATPRAVTLGLKALLRAHWARRTLIDDYPPTAGYELKGRGRQVLACVDGLWV